MGINYFSYLGFFFSSAVNLQVERQRGAELLNPRTSKKEVAGLESLGSSIFPVSRRNLERFH